MADIGPSLTHSILTTPEGASLAYHRVEGKTPGVVFLHGLQSDMTGAKALAVEDWCVKHGRAFLRFDQQGHGMSSGRFSDGSIGQWSWDTGYVLKKLTSGPNILVGSSMGGWLMLLSALRHRAHVAALVGIAAAPDFTRALTPRAPAFADSFDEAGNYFGPEPADASFPRLVLSSAFLRDGNANRVFEKLPVAIDLPVRLIQGLLDDTVPWETALQIQKALQGDDVTVTLVKDAGHRLSRDQDIDLILRELDTVVARLDAPIGCKDLKPTVSPGSL